MLAALERVTLAATRALSVVGLVALMGLAAMTLADGLLRWVANHPIEGVRDLGGLAIAVAIACCLPVGLMERANITIRLGKGLIGRGLEALASTAVCVALGLAAWQFSLYAEKMARARETTFVLQIPIAPFWYGVDAILWLAVLVQAIVVLRDWAQIFDDAA
jgi:TRAP-type C4-dicarboxylate transport system permease small subunit